MLPKFFRSFLNLAAAILTLVLASLTAFPLDSRAADSAPALPGDSPATAPQAGPTPPPRRSATPAPASAPASNRASAPAPTPATAPAAPPSTPSAAPASNRAAASATKGPATTTAPGGATASAATTPAAAETPKGELIHARGILVSYEGAKNAAPIVKRNKEQALSQARQIQQLAQRPESDFVALAKRYGDGITKENGGALPSFRTTDPVDPAIVKALTSITPGQVGAPVETEYGYYVFQRLAPEEKPTAAPIDPSETMGLRGILIAYSGAQNSLPGMRRSHAEAKELAVQIRLKARTPGTDFGKLATDYSDDMSAVRSGWVGRFTRDTLRKEFGDSLFRLKAGDVSEVLESPMGFHIFKREKDAFEPK